MQKNNIAEQSVDSYSHGNVMKNVRRSCENNPAKIITVKKIGTVIVCERS